MLQIIPKLSDVEKVLWVSMIVSSEIFVFFTYIMFNNNLISC